ncbi:MAG: hypothetical protein HZB16_01100 [Armatimonadetes bacterium]|nr:hypothetical protein [Armatimonadota bacterium]
MEERRYVVLTAAGVDRPGLVADLSAYVAERRGNVEDSRMSVLGGMFGIMMLLSGSDAATAAIAADLAGLETASGLHVQIHATTPTTVSADCTRLSFELHSSDREGLVHLVADHLRGAGGNIVRLDSSVYPAPVSGSPLFRLRVVVDLPRATAESAFAELVDWAESEGMETSALPAVTTPADG